MTGKTNKALTLDEIIKKMNTTAKEQVVTKGLGDYNYSRIPFTSPKLNYCTYGGIPEGRLTEFYGEEHGGKTTTALDTVANYQNLYPERNILWVDSENTLDEDWAKTLGVNVNDLYIFQPKGQSAEQIFDFILETVSTGEIGLWVLDSIGALFSDAEWEKSIADKTYAGISGPLTKFSKQITQIMHGKNSTGIGINQIRDILNSSWGGTTTPGGNGWRHMCSVRMEFRKGSFIDEHKKEISRSAEEPCGNIVKVNMLKNKTCPPKRHITEYTLNYDTGIDYIHDLVDLGILLDVIDQRGAWFQMVDVETGELIGDKVQGQDKLEQYLAEDDTALSRLETVLDKLITDK